METSGANRAVVADAMERLKSGQVAEAVSILEKAVVDHSNDPQIYTCLGVAYTNSGSKVNAVSAFEKALMLEKSVRGHYNLGVAYEALGRHGEALAEYRSAVALDSNYTAAIQAVDRLATSMPAVEPTLMGQASVASSASVASNQTAPDMNPDFSSIFKTSSVPPDLAREAYEKALRAEEQRRDYIKSAVLYGAGCGAAFLLLVYSLLLFLAGAFGASAGKLILAGLFTLLQGGVMGAIVGWWIGYTCGEDLQGALAGAVMGGLYGLVTGLIGGEGGMTLFAVMLHALLGAIFGFIVGKLVESSIGY